MMPKSRKSKTTPLDEAPIREHGCSRRLSAALLMLMALGMAVPASCASGDKNRTDPPGTSSHHPETPPPDIRVQYSPAYIENADYLSGPPGHYLHISGHLPTPCHQLAEPEFETEGDTLHITLKSWQKPEVMCAQVLEPFVYYLSPESYGIRVPEHIRVNGEAITLKEEEKR